MKKTILSLLCASTLLVGCDNQTNNTQSEKVTNEQVQTIIAKEFPILKNNFKVSYNNDLKMYQVLAAGQVMYVTNNGKYFIGGHYFKFDDNQKDYTQTFINENNKVEVAQLPLDLSVKEVKGNGKLKLFIFSDPDCPYCHLLQSKVIDKLNDVTVYSFLAPLDALHPNAHSDAVKILCSENPTKTYNEWLDVNPKDLDEQRPNILGNIVACSDGETKLSNLYNLMNKLMITGTPTIYNETGMVITPQDLVNLSSKVVLKETSSSPKTNSSSSK